ncbi:MAG TPA: prolyl oligopeptidase family serine peptidase [Thermoanaerobaculia bacterium]
MVHRSKPSLAFLLVLLGAASGLAAQGTPPVTLERIMSDPDWIGNPPEDPYWGDDGRSVYYERKRNGEERKDLIRLDLATGKSTVVEDRDRGAVDARGGKFNEDHTQKVYERRGDIYVKDLKTGTLRQITRTGTREESPQFLGGGTRISYRQGWNFYAVDLATGLVTQVADLRLEDDPAKEKDKSYLEEQQPRLFDVIREKQEREKKEREEEQAEQKADPTRAPLPWYLGKDVKIETAALSPSGRQLVVVTYPKPDEKPTKLARFVTESGNVETEEVRAKVGTEEPVPHAVALFDLEKHERHEVDLSGLPGIGEDPLAELRKKKKDEEDTKDAKDEKKLREVEVLGVAWSDDGSRVAVQLRARDNKDRWMGTLDAQGKLTLRHRLTDPAWINWGFNDFGWLRDDETLWYLSEESGYSQLYLVSDKTGKTRLLTPKGPYEVSDPVVDREGRFVYYRANHDHPGNYDVWRVEVASGKAEPLTRVGGLTEAALSPDEGRLLLLHSSATRPDELYVQDARPGAEARQVTNTRTPEFLAIEWSVPEIVGIPSQHGAGPIYSRVYTPQGFDPAKKYPAVLFVHGAGYLQNAHAGWSTYFREFMFHTLLTEQGYVVLDMDYRASSGYGRDWRTAIYRQMGFPEVEDLKDGVAWLVANQSVDRKRVGVYGGSYGGFLTFMSLFREPELFAAGAALRPVTDWAHYNQEYTSNILNTPETDPEAYLKSSPIEYAKGLNKPLLICSGMLDDNVFFQDTVRLVQRLIELEKQDFETALYPVERHGFVRPSSWLDEYRRVYKLFETHLK